jgi:hypothetical protein
MRQDRASEGGQRSHDRLMQVKEGSAGTLASFLRDCLIAACLIGGSETA